MSFQINVAGVVEVVSRSPLITIETVNHPRASAACRYVLQCSRAIVFSSRVTLLLSAIWRRPTQGAVPERLAMAQPVKGAT